MIQGMIKWCIWDDTTKCSFIIQAAIGSFQGLFICPPCALLSCAQLNLSFSVATRATKNV